MSEAPRALPRALKEALEPGERLSPLHPRGFSLEGWWGDDLNAAAPRGWPLPPGAAVIEARRGYQFGPENLTLPWALRGQSSASAVVDLGAGSGSLGLLAAYALGAERLVSVELQAEQCARLRRARASFAAAGEPLAWSVVEGDLRAPQCLGEAREALGGGGAEVAVLNPPFFPAGWGRESASEEVARSTHALFGGVEELLAAGVSLLAPGGALWVLYDGRRVGDLLGPMARLGVGLGGVWCTPDLRAGRGGEVNRVWVKMGLHTCQALIKSL